MRIPMTSIWVLLFLALATGPAWSFYASVNISVYNDDYEDHEVLLDYNIDGNSDYSYKDLASGDYLEYDKHATAWLWDEHTDTFTFTIKGDDDSDYCTTEITVKTYFDLGIVLKTCEHTSPQTTACTVTTDKDGTTCTAVITINK